MSGMNYPSPSGFKLAELCLDYTKQYGGFIFEGDKDYRYLRLALKEGI